LHDSTVGAIAGILHTQLLNLAKVETGQTHLLEGVTR
jgi:hypothetical protein